MTFKEEYERDNEKLHPGVDIKDRIIHKQKMVERAAKTRNKIVRYGSIAACFILVCIGLLAKGLNHQKMKLNEAMSNGTFRMEQLEESAEMAMGAIDYEDIKQETTDAGAEPEAYLDMDETKIFQIPTEPENLVSGISENGEKEFENDVLTVMQEEAVARKEILLLIPLLILVIVMIAWALFRKK